MGITGKITAKLIFFAIIAVSFLTCENDNNNGPDKKGDSYRKDSLSLVLSNALNTDSIKSAVTWLQGMGTRFALAGNRRAVAIRIRDRFRRLGYPDADLDSFQITKTWEGQTYSLWQFNVTAQLNGTLHPDSTNILGAHYDDILSEGDPFLKAPGANDNASGVAAMIEIARVMKVKNYTPSISILFAAFGAEELGLLGSADFVSKLAYSGRPVRIMINNDMIANISTSNRLLWGVKIKYYNNSEDLSTQASILCNKYIGLFSATDTAYNKNSDSYSFYLKDYKAIYFASDSPDYNYHSLNDIAGECDFNYCALVAGLSCVLLVHND